MNLLKVVGAQVELKNKKFDDIIIRRSLIFICMKYYQVMQVKKQVLKIRGFYLFAISFGTNSVAPQFKARVFF